MDHLFQGGSGAFGLLGRKKKKSKKSSTKKRARFKTSSPPKRTQRPVRLKYQDSRGNVAYGDFVWSHSENTWVEVCEGPDGIGLYESDGWKVLAWR